MSKKKEKIFKIFSILSFLKSGELFADIPAEYLATLADTTEEQDFFKGEVLFKEGEKGDSFYIISQGNISVKKGKSEIALSGPRECLGEMALLDSEPKSATCVVAKDAKLLHISSENYHQLLDTQPVMARALLKTLACRLRKTTKLTS